MFAVLGTDNTDDDDEIYFKQSQWLPEALEAVREAFGVEGVKKVEIWRVD